ncbi:hypothetical protein SERLA73DRAFT_169439 [Serpula lacrymans var. lacrymans S7.3]|uniref:Phytanoyl-CoA dioxygenase n=2 Tax=Serpula lacrymans var. lacrymans TaxID=341189 RepID=F8Q013_SERL3|nr:uncharacterized protein SERLADRAFT_450352 [Serpula lacrymans var. lacrymans S7.9]EGN98485.1 hypothetical protein SERLA73DRAFT_169439 [Serpula lacrymans var. lacrymans S7.3]EGO24062.1 hypothetical protein SERLADRAFT_450352 [Serpula lacrymans var. lacrymans S7.9]
MSTKEYKHLTPEQIDHFMEHGFIIVKNGFTKEKAEEWTQNIWVRLGLDPNDKATWDRERIHMPWHRRENVASFAPKVWEIMKELLGGEERIDQPSGSWGDSFIVNLGTDALERQDALDPRDLDNWHVDGDFFVHYLDSPEQALLVIPVYSEIKHRGGGTFIAPEGIDMVAKYLAAHPEGVLPTGMSFTPSTSTYTEPKDDPGYYSHLEEVKKCNKFFEITGEVGDVVLLHPLMLHSASKNHLRIPRIITNPPVSLKEPFIFSREDPNDFSLVERKTLKALGVDKLDYNITTERRRIVPRSRAMKDKLKLEEEKRLAELAAKNANSGISVAPTPIQVA